MKKKIDATENPSRLENASARALSADRSEQASRPGTFSTMMSDRVIFSSASIIAKFICTDCKIQMCIFS